MASPSVVDGILHDLAQPLAAIRALATTPLPPGDAAAADRLARIEALTGWMTALLRQASAADDDRPAGAPADAAAVALEVAMSAAAGYRGVLRCRPGTAAPVPLDPLDLRRAVGNLVDNATRAAGPAGQVELRVRRRRGRVRIEVSDDGPGLGRVPRQTGRGLAVALEVAARCGGAVELLDRPTGGARVLLELPLSHPARPA